MLPFLKPNVTNVIHGDSHITLLLLNLYLSSEGALEMGDGLCILLDLS
jgi:hypothetical protein